MQIILANVRTPEEREGDLLAQVMANRRGEERLREIVARYGLPRVRRSAADLLDYSERVTRAMLRGIPDGEYRFEDFLDDDGVTDEPVRIAVALRIQRRSRRSGFHRIEPAGGGVGERELCDRGVGRDVLFPLPDRSGRALQRRAVAADSRDRAGAQRGECGAAGGDGGGQCGDFAAHHGRDSGRAGARRCRTGFPRRVRAP